MAKDVLLAVENLSVRIGTEQILRNISFRVEEGEVVAIIGPNGAGKTTLLKALLGLIPHEGAITWRSNVRIGYVPQRFSVDRSLPLTVRELFLLHDKKFLLSGSETIERIRECLRMVEVEESALETMLGALSGGETQRILIAWALFDNPDVLLFDEPTAGIDISGEETVYNLLHDLQDRFGITIMLVSHELNVVFQYATTVLCINKTLTCHGAPATALSSEQLEKLYGSSSYFHHLHEHGNNHFSPQ